MHGEDLAQRLAFDYEILKSMRCSSFDFEAYRTSWELERQRNRIEPSGETSQARKYRLILRVPTLISRNDWAPVTEIGVDVDVADYPMTEPTTWVLSPHTPWSPHFKAGYPVCIGEELWNDQDGHVTLGHLVVHLQHLLNWDEKGRGGGYVGWNEAAIRHHEKALRGKPLHSPFEYARLPEWLLGESESPTFEIESWSGTSLNDSDFEVL